VVSVARPPVAATAIAASSGIDPGFAEIERLGREQAGQVLERAQATGEAAGLRVSTHSASGSPSEAILDVAESNGADLIVVGNRGMKGARRILGSVPNNVAHHADCAVLIVPTS
jgi:nucleotide-binding universal stress UspA family protein